MRGSNVGIQIHQVDAFTERPFRGNPAAVCLLDETRDERWMQNVALEMNLSETAFLHEVEDGYNLRWFTPRVEVALCGHATLASAHVLWEQGMVGAEDLCRFHSRSGLLTARKKEDWIELDFPALPVETSGEPPGLGEALGVRPRYVGRSRDNYLVEVGSEKIVRELAPDLQALEAVTKRGVVVTSRSSTSGFDFVSRFFAPNAGIDEDPVTGSSHCTLGPFWQDRLGKTEFVAYQASPRGGVVRVRVSNSRVFLSGQAVTVMRGELL